MAAEHLLEREMTRLRTDLLAAQQREAEAKQATLLAEFTQLLAEKQTDRLMGVIEVSIFVFFMLSPLLRLSENNSNSQEKRLATSPNR